MRKTKVLVADDNLDLRSGLEIQLLVHGYEVVTCANADSAVANAQKHRPDVMIIDIWMDSQNRMILSGTGNGFGVIERINNMPETSGIPVIYITGESSPQLDVRAKQLGAFGLIHKPVNFDALLKMVELAAQTRALCAPEVQSGSEAVSASIARA
jgi:CheY-like chemotaxis protein